LRGGIPVHDELALSSTAQDWVDKEQRGKADLLKNILEKDMFLLMGLLRQGLEDDPSFDDQGRSALVQVAAEGVPEGGWEKLASRLRPVFSGLSDERQGFCRRLWEHISLMHTVEAAVLKIFTDAGPSRDDLLGALREVCEPLDFDADEILTYLVLVEPLSLEELRQKAQEFRDVLHPEVYGRLVELIVERTVLFTRDELGEFSRAFERLKTLDFPPETFMKFHEIRRDEEAPFKAAYVPTSKTLVFNVSDLGRVKISALVEHVIRHAVDTTLRDRKAPATRRRFFPSYDGAQVQGEDGPLFSRSAFSPLFRKMKGVPAQGYIPTGIPPGALTSAPRPAAPDQKGPAPGEKGPAPTSPMGRMPLYGIPTTMASRPEEPPRAKG